MLINQVKIRYFKKFKDEVFDLTNSIVLAGPNNSGKSTLLQALAAWYLALQKWLTERGPQSGSRASKRTGVAITRKDFTTLPLREMNLLWFNRSTALFKEELAAGQKPGTPRILQIELTGKNNTSAWRLALEFTYRYPDLIHVRPAADTPIEPLLDFVRNLRVVHVPPFSGIGAEETRYDQAYQDLLIGQGKPGDILRNLLLEINRQHPEAWAALVNDIETIFKYKLLPPVYEGLPFINCEFQSQSVRDANERARPKLDIASAGSGFLQILMLLAFFYARPASVLLLDEPDAHLHLILQKQIYDRLREIVRQRNCQLLIATHSEVLIDSTSPDQILSFYRKPHKLYVHTEKEQVREALKRLTSIDMLMAELAPGILYVEGETDLNLLREWARILQHPSRKFLEEPFWHGNQGRHPREARSHFFALKAIKPDYRGILLLDGDNRALPEHEISAEGLLIMRWRRYEAENYLLHPEALFRFVTREWSTESPDLFAQAGVDFLKEQLPPAVFSNPLQEHDYLNATPASKALLPAFFEAASVTISKNDYYQVAAAMKPEEIPQEVIEKLDIIATTTHLNQG
ncbi:MAG: ATP-dependent endonuclease [bacterium]